MSSATTVLRGVVHGKTIELLDAPDLPDGQDVTVTLHCTQSATKLTPGEGLRRAFGAWAEAGEELDQYLVWNRAQRKLGRREVEP